MVEGMEDVHYGTLCLDKSTKCLRYFIDIMECASPETFTFHVIPRDFWTFNCVRNRIIQYKSQVALS